MRWRARVWSGAIATVALLLIAWVVVALKRSEGQARRGSLSQTPGHSYVRLVSVMVGTNFNYRVAPTKPWIQKVLKALPAPIGSYFDPWLGMGSGSMGLSSPHGRTNIAIFTASEEPSGSRRPEALVVVDEDGDNVLGTQGASVIGSDDGQRFRAIKGWLLEGFPRRKKHLRLRLVRVSGDQKSWEPIAEFRISNPLFGRYPTWTPEALPTTKRDGDLGVVLAKLDTGVRLIQPSRVGFPSTTLFTQARFKVLESGRPTQAWLAKSIEVSDATGNLWSPFVPPDSIKREGDSVQLSFLGLLWPGESAWKLRVEFSRCSEFDTSELWKVGGLRVPQAGEVLDLQNAVTNQGVGLTLVAFCGAAADQPGDYKWLMEKGHPRVSVHADKIAEGWRLSLVRAVDQQGREVEIDDGQDWGWSNGNRVFGLKLPPDASHVDCTFALHQSRFVEFLAQPAYRKN